jgi:hypothetical protein
LENTNRPTLLGIFDDDRQADRAVAGSLVGSLTGMGVPEDEACYADEQFQRGRVIVTVRTDGRLDEAQTILQSFGAHYMRHDQTVSARAL